MFIRNSDRQPDGVRKPNLREGKMAMRRFAEKEKAVGSDRDFADETTVERKGEAQRHHFRFVVGVGRQAANFVNVVDVVAHGPGRGLEIDPIPFHVRRAFYFVIVVLCFTIVLALDRTSLSLLLLRQAEVAGGGGAWVLHRLVD